MPTLTMIVRLALLLPVLLVASTAEAAPTAARLCFRWQPDFLDNTLEDRLNDDQDVAAVGGFIEVLRGSQLVWRGRTDAAAGCTTVPLDSDFSYEIRMYADAFIATGHRILYVDAFNRPRYRTVSYSFRPAAPSDSETFVWGPGSEAEASSVMAAASYVVRHARGTISANVEWILTDGSCPEPNAGVACYWRDDGSNTGTAFLAGGMRRKFTVAHELGHHVNTVFGNLPPDGVYTITEGASGSCRSETDSHTLQSLEYQSAAAKEGFANFVAALAFNQTGESDCFFDAEDCEGNSQYAERVCFTSAEGTFVPRPGLGNEMDWTRTLWDLRTDRGVSTTLLYQLMSSLQGNRVQTYSSALNRAEQLGITSFESVARANGINY